jgi:hypothetical protein
VTRPSRALLFPLLLAWAAAFAAWTPSLSGSFLKDDDSNFVSNPVVRTPALWPTFFYVKSANSLERELTVAYRPLATLSYAVTARLAGFNPFFFHLLDCAGHAANAALVLLIGWELCGSLPAAAVGAILFAFHPAQAESVSYASGARPSVFSLLFCLLALREHLKGRRPRALALFAAGALFKESALALPIALAAWEWVAAPRKALRAVARSTAPYFVFAACFTVVRGVILGHTTDSGLYGGRLLSHIGFALAGLAVHARSAAWPHGQRLCYTLTDPAGPGLALAGAAILAALVFLFARGLRGRRAWIAGLAWAAAFLLPVSNFLIPVSSLAADRYLYASFAGLAWLAAFAASRAPKRWAWLPAAALAAWLVPLCVERQADWQTAFTIDLAGHQAGEDACTSAILAVDYFNWGMDGRARELVREGLSRRPCPAARAYLTFMDGLLDQRSK